MREVLGQILLDTSDPKWALVNRFDALFALRALRA
jgi:hypothetical protein